MGRRFCAECGKSDEPLYENFCHDCYWKYNQLTSVKKERIEIPYCLTCFAVKLPNGWSRDNEKHNLPEVVAYGFMRNVVMDSETVLEISEFSDINWINPNPEFTIYYTARNSEIQDFPIHEEEISFEVKLIGGICKTCVRRKTGTHDVTIQLRSKNRSLIKEEIDKATTIAFTKANESYHETSDAYVSDIIENHGGLDFYLGNTMLADSIISQFKKTWIGHYEKNYKLVTEEKDNKRVYRVTQLYRIPEVKHGDYVTINNDLCMVNNIGPNVIKMTDLKTGITINTSKWDELVLVNPLPYPTKKLVISEDQTTKSYLLMDLISFENEEISMDNFYKPLPISEEISLLIWNNQYYLPI